MRIIFISRRLREVVKDEKINNDQLDFIGNFFIERVSLCLAAFHGYGHFGVFIAPPPLWIPPPPAVYYRGYYPPPSLLWTRITTNLIEPGSRATGSRGGLPMVGKGSGFPVLEIGP